jgi:N-acetylglutamate synthase-like GNAT family acetyltransferase
MNALDELLSEGALASYEAVMTGAAVAAAVDAGAPKAVQRAEVEVFAPPFALANEPGAYVNVMTKWFSDDEHIGTMGCYLSMSDPTVLEFASMTLKDEWQGSGTLAYLHKTIPDWARSVGIEKCVIRQPNDSVRRIFGEAGYAEVFQDPNAPAKVGEVADDRPVLLEVVIPAEDVSPPEQYAAWKLDGGNKPDWIEEAVDE